MELVRDHQKRAVVPSDFHKSPFGIWLARANGLRLFGFWGIWVQGRNKRDMASDCNNHMVVS